MISPRIRHGVATASLAVGLLFSGPRLLAADEPIPTEIEANDWWRIARQRLAAAEYHFSWKEAPQLPQVDAAWQAPNRAQGFRAHIDGNALHLVPRRNDDTSWSWRMALVGYGRAGALDAVEAASLTVNESRLDLARGEINEWYVNSPAGLEQGFDLLAPPRSAESVPADAPLELWLEISGDLVPRISTDGGSIDLILPGRGAVLRYAKLLVTDSAQRELPAWLALDAALGRQHVRIVVDDRDASYPITVDPLLTAAAWSTEADQNDAQLGWSVASAGDINGDGFSDVIVGARRYDEGRIDEGVAFVFMGSPSGLATTPAWFTEGGQSNAEFGSSVATAGDVNGDGYADVIVGSPYHSNGHAFEGRAYVFHGGNGGLENLPAWFAESNQSFATFGGEMGYSVAGAGDVNGDGYGDVIIGARRYANGESSEGHAFIYFGSASGLDLDGTRPEGTPANADWKVEANQTNAFLGESVARAGDVNGDGYSDVIVGAFLYDNGQLDEGAVFVYHGSALGPSLTPDAVLEANQSMASFGLSIGTAGDVNGDGYADVIVGAPQYSNGESQEGRAYVFPGSASGVSTVPLWTTESNRAGSRLGSSVGTAGDVEGDGYADVIIGAPRYTNGQTQEGRVYVFSGSATGPGLAPSWTSESDQANAHYGASVAAAGDVNGDGYSDVIVGAPFFANGETGEGTAWVYLGSAAGPAATPGWTADGDQDGAQLGFSVAGAGDVNGDGYADVLVGAPFYDNGATDEGKVWAFHGSGGGLSPAAAWSTEGNSSGAQLGIALGTAGDVNGDGFADVILGAGGFDDEDVDEGRVYVHHGSASGLSVFPSWLAGGGQGGARFGDAVGAAGDINGDGYGDVIIGAPFYDNGQLDEGRAYLYVGSATGLSVLPSWISEGDKPGAEFGASVGTAGDVNADRFSDVIIGAPGWSNGHDGEGQAALFYGSALGMHLTPFWTVEGNQTDARLGAAVGTAGDVNGDRYSDVIVGAPGWNGTFVGEGLARVFHGRAGVPSVNSQWQITGGQIGAALGRAVALAGDVNGDGFADVLVGSPLWDGGDVDAGRAALYLGHAAGLDLVPVWSYESDAAESNLGAALASAGDVNGDGFADILVGAPSFADDQNDEGRALLFYGNGGAGFSLTPLQLRGDGQALVSPLGRSLCTDCFRIGLLARNPLGRGLMRLEREVVPLGTLLDGTGTVVTSWFDAGAAGQVLDELVEELTPGEVYHWRVRLQYHPQTSPILPASRWLSVPWNSWQEADLRTGGCLDADGDGYGAIGDASCPQGMSVDCDDQNANCNSDCTDADDDGFCVTTDCDDNIASCTLSCIDGDDDGLYVCAGDCLDSDPDCTTECIDADSDGLFVCQGDCNDANPNCTTDCTDADADGFCVTTDCDDANPNCTTDCTDADADGFCVTTDCNDGNLHCTTDCTDTDGDGVCVTADCDDGNPAASPLGSEVCTDDADNDCNGLFDGADPVCAGLVTGALRFTTENTMIWDGAPGADAHALYRGSLPFAGYDHVCEATELPGTTAQDDDVPYPGEGFYYLATGLRIEPGRFGTFFPGPLGPSTAQTSRPDSATIRCGPRVYVDPDVVLGPPDGLSWATAYTSLSAAVLHGRSPERGAEIWVRGTIGSIAVQLNGNQRSAARILGGFSGTESLPWQRAPETTPTVWTGNGVTAQLLRAIDAHVVVDGVTLRDVAVGVEVSGVARRVELSGVTMEGIFQHGLDFTADAGGQLLLLNSELDPIRAVCRSGTLGGRIRGNSIAAGTHPGLRLEARAAGADATTRLDIIGNRISGGTRGVVLGAHVNDQPVHALEASFFASNFVYGGSGDGVTVEAGGAFAVTNDAASAQALSLVIGNTISDTGGHGLLSSAARIDTTPVPSVHPVRAVPQVWDNQLTFHTLAGGAESSDNPASNVVADPVFVGNNLFGCGTLYLDEGVTPVDEPLELLVLPGLLDNLVMDPLYVDSDAGDYHILPPLARVEAGTVARYLVNLSDPGIGLDWTQPGFDDSGWASGAYGMGYDESGGPPWYTPIISTPVALQAFSVYTRVQFTVADLDEVRNVFFGVDYDDGYVAWLNGVEFVRSASMPPGDPAWNTESGLHEGSNAPQPVYDAEDVSSTAIPLLQQGMNTLVVGVWNGPIPSSDLLLVPQLVLNRTASVDAGHSNAPRIARTDIDGESRSRDGDGDGMARPDVGADER